MSLFTFPPFFSLQDLLARPQDPANLEFSVELCGGTHLSRSGEAKLFVILSEGGISQGSESLLSSSSFSPFSFSFLSGVRRIVAATGAGAERVLENAKTARRMIQEVQKMSEHDPKFETEVGALNQYVNQTPLPAREIGQLRESIAALTERGSAARNQRIETAIAASKVHIFLFVFPQV